MSAHVEIDAAIVGEVRAIDLGVLVIIRGHLNRGSGLCNPSVSRVAHLAQISHDSAQRSIERLERGGLLVVHRTKGECNSYSFPKPHAKTGEVTTRKNGGRYTQDHTQNCPRNKVQPRTLIKEQHLSGTDVPGDLRHDPVRRSIQKLHQQTFGNVCEWNGREGKALKKLLKENPGWDVESLLAMVENRFNSEAIRPARPAIWIPRLGEYAAGPLDRYGNVWSDTRPRLQEGLRYEPGDDYVA